MTATLIEKTNIQTPIPDTCHNNGEYNYEEYKRKPTVPIVKRVKNKKTNEIQQIVEYIPAFNMIQVLEVTDIKKFKWEWTAFAPNELGIYPYIKKTIRKYKFYELRASNH